ncbi:hypothetical protein NLJ89_g7925 [Agrocybe chaxingu]|uniref:Uncharacterized protein n=1 Tax=Agrocybe chaxingu TaxID=84603 RepID=A0A9W8MV01_9AGAR|nr:hypothetical protein NLJ89_g7925 [Agrocybe chaxingu]
MFPTAMIDFVLGRPKLVKKFQGHKGPVNCMAFSPKGAFLVSGGEDGLRVWDLHAMKELRLPDQNIDEKNYVASVCWLMKPYESVDTLCYGNGTGFLVFLQHCPSQNGFNIIHSCRIGGGREISTITADRDSHDASTRIAMGTRDKYVQVWTFDANTRTLLLCNSKVYGESHEVIPKALAFDNNSERDLYVFGIFDGGLYKYAGTKFDLIVRHQLGTQIGNAATDLNSKLCVVDNAKNGFDLYRMDTGMFVRKFTTRDATRINPKNVTFANDLQAVVGGSNHGVAYIFERNTGRVLKMLKHSKRGGVETVTAHDNNDGSVAIATASSTAIGSNEILLWKWKPKTQAEGSVVSRGWSFLGFIEVVLKIVMLFSTIAYFSGLVNEKLGGRLYELPRVMMGPTAPNHQELHELVRQAVLTQMQEKQGVELEDKGTEMKKVALGKWM